MRRKYKRIGSFEMTGTVMRVSDPCYDKMTWCSGTLPDCLPGQWDAAVAYSDEGDMGIRVSILVAKHHNTVRSFALCNRVWADEKYTYYAGGWKISDIEVGVDSGQAGLFDEAHYQDEGVFAGQPKPSPSYGDIWYSHCCKQTLGKHQAGTIPYGVVSSSGFGDGGYTALSHKNTEGQVDAVAILYLAEHK